MTDSEFDRQMIEAFAEDRESPVLWPKVKSKLPKSPTWAEFLLPALAASLTLLLLHAGWSGQLHPPKQPEPVAMIDLSNHKSQ